MKNIEFKIKIDGQESIKSLDQLLNDSATSFDHLKQKKNELEQAFGNAEFGTPEFKALQAELRKTNTQLKELDETISDITFADKMDGFFKATQAVAGGFSILVVGAAQFGEQLGITEEEAKKLEQSMLQLLVVMDGLNNISAVFSKDNKLFNALQSINLSSKSTAEGMSEIGGKTGLATKAMNIFGKVGKSAMIATGIGVVVVALSLMVEYWDDITAGVKRLTKQLSEYVPFIKTIIDSGLSFKEIWSGSIEAIKQAFLGLGSLVMDLGSSMGKLFTGDFTGAIDGAKNALSGYTNGIKNAVKETINQSRSNEKLIEQNKVLNKGIEDRTNLIKIQAAAGKDTSDLEKRQFDDKIKMMNNELAIMKSNGDAETEEYKKKVSELKTLETDYQVFLTTKRNEALKKRNEEAAKQAEIEKNRLKESNELEKSILDNKSNYNNLEYKDKLETSRKIYEDQVKWINLNIKDVKKATEAKEKVEREHKDRINQIEADNLKELKAIRDKEFNNDIKNVTDFFDLDKNIATERLNLEIEAQEARLETIEKISGMESEDYKEQKERLKELYINKAKMDYEYTKSVIEQNRARALSQIEAINILDENGKVDLQKKKDRDKALADTNARFDQLVYNNQLKLQNDLKNIEKLFDNWKEKNAEQKAQKIIEFTQQTFQGVANMINMYLDSTLNKNLEVITRIRGEMDALDERIRQQEDLRDANLEKAKQFDETIQAGYNNLQNLEDKSSDLYEKIIQAQKTGNTALVNSLKSQQDELKKKIAIERQNVEIINEAKEASNLSFLENEKNIIKLREEKEKLANEERDAMNKQIEIQKQKIKLDKAMAYVNMGVAIANLAVKSASNDASFGVITGLAITALSSVLTAVIPNLVERGFDTGGYTGDGYGKNDSSGFKVAGRVHEGEYVVPKRMVDNPRFQPVIKNLENARINGYAEGGMVGGSSMVIEKSIMEMATRPIYVAIKDIRDAQDILNATITDARL